MASNSNYLSPLRPGEHALHQEPWLAQLRPVSRRPGTNLLFLNRTGKAPKMTTWLMVSEPHPHSLMSSPASVTSRGRCQVWFLFLAPHRPAQGLANRISILLERGCLLCMCNSLLSVDVFFQLAPIYQAFSVGSWSVLGAMLSQLGGAENNKWEISWCRHWIYLMFTNRTLSF